MPSSTSKRGWVDSCGETNWFQYFVPMNTAGSSTIKVRIPPASRSPSASYDGKKDGIATACGEDSARGKLVLLSLFGEQIDHNDRGFCRLDNESCRNTFQRMRPNKILITTTTSKLAPVARQTLHHRQVPTHFRHRRQSLSLAQQAIALRPMINQQPREHDILRHHTTVQWQTPPAHPSIHVRAPAQEHLRRARPVHAHELQRRDGMPRARRVEQDIHWNAAVEHPLEHAGHAAVRRAHQLVGAEPRAAVDQQIRDGLGAVHAGEHERRAPVVFGRPVDVGPGVEDERDVGGVAAEHRALQRRDAVSDAVAQRLVDGHAEGDYGRDERGGAVMRGVVQWPRVDPVAGNAD